jgi:crossover junction endodeoxyribonuclease RuvC
MARLLGIDPGLRFTGWGVIEVDGNRLRHVADGVIATDSAISVPKRLKALHDALVALMAQYRPDEAAIEETYVNRNGAATLKLGYARGVALLAPALAGIPVTEYGAKAVKLAVVGTGGAAKEQVQMRVRQLLPGARFADGQTSRHRSRSAHHRLGRDRSGRRPCVLCCRRHHRHRQRGQCAGAAEGPT